MPIASTVTSFLTSGSSSFGGWNSALIVHSDSGFQRKAGPLNQRVTLLTFVVSPLLNHHRLGYLLMRCIPIALYLSFLLLSDPSSHKDLKTLGFIVDVALSVQYVSS